MPARPRSTRGGAARAADPFAAAPAAAAAPPGFLAASQRDQPLLPAGEASALLATFDAEWMAAQRSQRSSAPHAAPSGPQPQLRYVARARPARRAEPPGAALRASRCRLAPPPSCWASAPPTRRRAWRRSKPGRAASACRASCCTGWTRRACRRPCPGASRAAAARARAERRVAAPSSSSITAPAATPTSPATGARRAACCSRRRCRTESSGACLYSRALRGRTGLTRVIRRQYGYLPVELFSE